jgi:hypothetical protein
MASSGKPLVLLFEDDKKKGDEFAKGFEAALRPKFAFQRYDLYLQPDKIDVPYEDLLAQKLSETKFRDLALIVSDRDISRSGRYPGLSEAAVCKAAAELGIPVCVYASGKSDDVLERQRSGGDGRIVLDAKNMMSTVPVIAQGMLDVRERLAKILSKTSKSQPAGSAALLAKVLEMSDATDHLALYARGDQKMIAQLLPERRKHPARTAAHKDVDESKRVATALGVWLYDSVLRFPGLILDRLAASSFLGIDFKSMERPEVRSTFASAEYKGPFFDDAEPMWWRHLLVEILGKAGVEMGRDAVKVKAGGPIRPCVCSVDKRSPAGFVCVVTRAAVCEVHSVGQISWLPRGADLARVRRDVFDEIGPWIGT